MDKDATITFRVPQATRDALERAAAAEKRSLSNLVLAVLTDYVEAREEPKARFARRGARSKH